MNEQQIINHYNMQAHPEGGYFVETYRSELKVETPSGERSASTAIHFLISKDSISHFHRLRSDEGWHFHMGAPLKVIEITPEGKLIETIMGIDISAGHKLQHFVPAGHWFASTSLGDLSFVGCTVAPGFDFVDFEMGKRDMLSKQFPGLVDTLESYCLQ